VADSVVTLEQLLDHAVKNADKSFDMNDCTTCLAADLTGVPMSGFSGFTSSSTRVDDRFEEYLRELCPNGCGGVVWRTGRQLAADLTRLIDGVHPAQVAQESGR
jgi:hypothetical protein